MSFASAMEAHLANVMTKKIMTKAIICVIEGALVGLAVVIVWRTICSL
jgi:hypothetical protein